MGFKKRLLRETSCSLTSVAISYLDRVEFRDTVYVMQTIIAADVTKPSDIQMQLTKDTKNMSRQLKANRLASREQISRRLPLRLLTINYSHCVQGTNDHREYISQSFLRASAPPKSKFV